MVEIVKSMWSEPDTTYAGRFFSMDGAKCDPKPVQTPHPPILIGGEQLTLRVVARHADRSNFGGKPHEFVHKCEVLKGHCAAVGRDYDEIMKACSPPRSCPSSADHRALRRRSRSETDLDLRNLENGSSVGPAGRPAGRRLFVVAEDDLGHARRLGGALDLEGEAHRHLGAALDVVDAEQFGAEAQHRAHRHG